MRLERVGLPHYWPEGKNNPTSSSGRATRTKHSCKVHRGDKNTLQHFFPQYLSKDSFDLCQGIPCSKARQSSSSSSVENVKLNFNFPTEGPLFEVKLPGVRWKRCQRWRWLRHRTRHSIYWSSACDLTSLALSDDRYS